MKLDIKQNKKVVLISKILFYKLSTLYDFIVIGRKIILEGNTISVVWHTCYSDSDTSFEILKCNIKILEKYHIIMISNAL